MQFFVLCKLKISIDQNNEHRRTIRAYGKTFSWQKLIVHYCIVDVAYIQLGK